MAEKTPPVAELPVVNVLHGEDEHGILQALAAMQASLGDPSMASMNITRLDGQNATMDELVNACMAGPFLCPRRLVILTRPLAMETAKKKREVFEAFLEKLPVTTILALVHYETLGTKKRGNYNPHWLEVWVKNHEGRGKVRRFDNSPEEMATKIYAMAKSAGVEVQVQAAQELARLVGPDTMLASQEVQKLAAYVNYGRPVTIEDVRLLVEDTAPANIFAMVDQMSKGKGREAANLLHKLLEESEPLELMGMITRQFRLLLLAREVLDNRGTLQDVAKACDFAQNQTWLAQKYMDQARQYSLKDLIVIYHRLLDIDEAIKTGGMDAVLALDLLIAGLSGQKAALKV